MCDSDSACCVFKLSHTLVTTHRCVAFAWKNNRIREEVPLRIENVDYQTGYQTLPISDPSCAENSWGFTTLKSWGEKKRSGRSGDSCSEKKTVQNKSQRDSLKERECVIECCWALCHSPSKKKLKWGGQNSAVTSCLGAHIYLKCTSLGLKTQQQMCVTLSSLRLVYIF